MSVTNPVLLDAYASIAQQTYLPNAITLNVETDDTFGTYTEITQLVDGPLGFQARAFFNDTTNDLVIAFTGTEGFDDASLSEALPDRIADFGLAVAGASPQDIAAQAFISRHCL